MSRLSKNVVVISEPLRIFPNGDYFYIELSRKSTLYTCAVKMACGGNPLETVGVAKADGKTIREAEELAFERAVNRCPGFPRPPYLRRRAKKPVVAQEFHKVAAPRPKVRDQEKVETARR